MSESEVRIAKEMARKVDLLIQKWSRQVIETDAELLRKMAYGEATLDDLINAEVMALNKRDAIRGIQDLMEGIEGALSGLDVSLGILDADTLRLREGGLLHRGEEMEANE